jgi:hypothetical protein
VNCQLSTFSGVVFEKLIFPKFVKKFLAFYETWRSITVFTRARHLPPSWSWTRLNYFTHSHISWRHTLILPTHLRLCLPSSLFPSSFQTKTMYALLLAPPKCVTCSAHLLLFIDQIIFYDTNFEALIMQFSPIHTNFLFTKLNFLQSLISLRPKYIPQHPVFKTVNPCFSNSVRDQVSQLHKNVYTHFDIFG